MSKTLLVQRDLSTPMRDGVQLKSDLYRPRGDQPLPVILLRTPYGKGFSNTSFALWAAESGYAVVIQDTRGRWSSEGEGYPFVNEQDDGYDTISWIAGQPWCNGRVGMSGVSYVGFTQFAAATRQPPALKAIIPAFSFCDPYDFLYRGGALNLGASVSWGLLAGAQMALMRQAESGLLSALAQGRLMEQFIELVDGMAHGQTFSWLPLEDLPLIGKSGLLPLLGDAIAHPQRDEYWQRAACSPKDITVPAFHIGGWYDTFISSTLADFVTLREQGTAPQKLLVGPWVHGNIDSSAGEVDFGLRAAPMLLLPDELELRWMDYWLKDEPNGVLAEPPVRLFIMGANRWRDEQEWPLARAVATPFYLHSQGSANTLHGDGHLSLELPNDEPMDSFAYDPRNPVPTRGGPLCCWNPALPPGAYDQRPVEERPDVLVYSTSPLEEGLEVTGPVRVHLWAASSAPDTDFTAKLVDVGLCGFARNVSEGIVRASLGKVDQPGPLQPGQAYQLVIELNPTANYFQPGHCLRLDISSSSFPAYARSPNTGQDHGRAVELRPALQMVFHDAAHPSHIVLPVVNK
jgi:uncharacterized protein